jgi:hypothetical protein
MSMKRPSYFLRIVFLVDNFRGRPLFNEYPKHDFAKDLIDSCVLNIPKTQPASAGALNS